VTGETEAVARFAVESDPLAASPGVARPARHAILDTLGVALAGAREPVATTIAQYVLAQGGPSTGEPGACTLWAQAAATSAQFAALANGAAAHALDFDDISHTMRGRPSAAVLPAVFAVGERQHASGAEVLAAYIVGVEVECKLGKLSANPTYERGWQTSCTLGVIGATATARLAASLRSDPYAVVTAAMGVGSGAQQARPFLTLQAMFGRIDDPDGALGVLSERLQQDGDVPGFHPRQYRVADPRARLLLTLLSERVPDSGRLAGIRRIVDVMRERRGAEPSVEVAVAALAALANMRAGAGEGIFRTARTAGWIGHAVQIYAQSPRTDLPSLLYS
jgi:2-methylcitrate dehydratase MmgE/PrpD-like protein/citrate synthase